MKWSDLDHDSCPVARAMSVVGDRWTLLILREAFLGTRRFDGFQDRLGITRHLLAERLKKLEALGLMHRVPYQERPLRHEYRLTPAGRAFGPVMLMLVDWATDNLPSDLRPPIRVVSHTDGHEVDPVVVDRTTGAPLTYETMRLRRT
ncbi:helix-turn-helix transcriptional regulator [Ruegeria sp. WL0004]|uniref:Helix-turn-helix transcriptional regulator n=1 Tax=Ruegeria marisflavi TaxID=2984152 RepID=A0ABT2WS61_9RHOB|nr:helix-turn-helix domain-containing protein [Ruegeria sp. WL0004]MCU9838709.1 helix-turn-helix transcriptional regulator [Ruegeria sp. WL0004]